MASSLRGTRVIVAGAGLAGLTAAYELTRRGAEVRVIEARDRLGGRVWTWRAAPLHPHHAELGGELVESDHAAIRGLCRHFHLRLRRILLRGFGLVINEGARARVVHRQTTLWKRFSAAFAPHVDALEHAGGDWTSSAAAAIARLSVQQVLDRSRVPTAVDALALALRNLYAADPDQLSALIAAEEVKGGGDPSALAMYRIDGGSDRLVLKLAAAARCPIDRGHVVRTVTQDDRGVRVGIERPNGRMTVARANFVVIAAPVPLVRAMRFSPALPDPQRRAIESIGVGAATKALLRFDRPWWRRPGLPRAFGTTLPIGAVWDSAEEQRDAAILTLLGGGRASASLQRALRRGPDAVAAALAWFNRGPRETPEVHWVAWERDPFARGAYEYFGPAFDPALQPLLGRAFGRVFFAGSHTSRDYLGYMNGAVESGQRAARELAALAPVIAAAPAD